MPSIATKLIAIATLSATALAGPLTPPAGAPAPTNLTLAEMEPRTPISGPTTITQPGSYYLTGDINTTFRGVEIQTDGVALDLNGFTINGDGVGTASDIGILISAVDNDLPITIKNGYVRNFTGDGVATATSAASLVVHNVHVDDCSDGFDSIGTANLIDCSARNCAADGFRINSSGRSAVVRCIAEDNASDGIQIDNGAARDCAAFNNGAAGFTVGSDATLAGCVSTNNTTGFSSSAGVTYNDCVASINVGNGFSSSTSTTFINCTSRSNGGVGFITSNGSAFNNCSSRLNALEGFITGAGSSVTNCAAASNQEDGFQLNSDARLFNCVADGNGTSGATFAGFRGSSDTTIDSCTATDNPTGFIGGNGGLLIRCSAAGNSTNYDTTGTDHGLIISPAGGFTSSNAWANISY